MGLFSFGKKKLTEGFEFSIEETFALKDNNSIVVTGKLSQGRFIPGTMAVCLDADRRPVFRCRIEGIEQGTKILKIATADAKGTYGSRYGLKLGGVKREQVPEEGVLVTETEELLEELKERMDELAVQARARAQARVEKTTAPETEAEDPMAAARHEAAQREEERKRAEEMAGPLGYEREEELAALLAGDAVDTAKLAKLTIQESIFLLCRLQSANRRSPVEHYEEKGQTLFTEILEKLRSADSLFVLLDEGSSLPFILGDTVDVYSTKELAVQAASFYEKQYRHLLVKEVPKGRTDLPGRLSLFAWLYYLGMERILVDNGSYQLIVKRADILPSAAETAAKDAVPVCNPSFRFAMADFLEETRWHVDYPEREENIKTKNERMMKELKKARFLVPMKYEGGALKRGENHISLSKGGSMTFPKVQNNKGTYFLPLFTDWPEFQRAYRKEEWSATVFTINDGIHVAGKDGIVINPLTENLVIKNEMFAEIKESH
ncbi:SseB family protein [Lacrimispora sp. 210928-DFI.3.58]|uniref:SseB family protein n=1 Tax=Lacrimispora sp. 210928-DFI.3.58 TaxID=2883214 RepID=UPI001D06FA96|nr:SseB family protein [Lacrimispora sp. 210928-DFI.3.58]MCB7319053.1 SseB family protein [Lacrimispora sp. 210928-DFI.3.58]